MPPKAQAEQGPPAQMSRRRKCPAGIQAFESEISDGCRADRRSWSSWVQGWASGYRHIDCGDTAGVNIYNNKGKNREGQRLMV
jgi:hypothetical protein